MYLSLGLFPPWGSDDEFLLEMSPAAMTHQQSLWWPIPWGCRFCMPPDSQVLTKWKDNRSGRSTKQGATVHAAPAFQSCFTSITKFLAPSGVQTSHSLGRELFLILQAIPHRWIRHSQAVSILPFPLSHLFLWKLIRCQVTRPAP